MKIKDILKKIDDFGLFVEIIEKESGASFGIYKKNDALIVYNNTLKNKGIKNINCQYFKGKRVLILYV